mgnify:CR=1 FL=1
MKTKQIVFTKAYTAELLDVDYEAPKAGEVTVEGDWSNAAFLDGFNLARGGEFEAAIEQVA